MYKLFFSLLLAMCVFIVGCQKGSSPLQSTDAFAKTDESESQGDIIDKFIFLGESTTYHLKSRGVLSGGTQTTQVWAPKAELLCLTHLQLTVE